MLVRMQNTLHFMTNSAMEYLEKRPREFFEVIMILLQLNIYSLSYDISCHKTPSSHSVLACCMGYSLFLSVIVTFIQQLQC